MTVRPGKKFGFQSAAENLQRRRHASKKNTKSTKNDKIKEESTKTNMVVFRAVPEESREICGGGGYHVSCDEGRHHVFSTLMASLVELVCFVVDSPLTYQQTAIQPAAVANSTPKHGV